ncbi:DUF92 domain-containing protein [Xanthocytophaga flava]|uniref:DUF92 domain-containing protein n=1 Tax=Xanthocytophaga flava TaxID=3048013 RepID=UPI0028D74273|nr:DUF92 domain-containing protein [Xanthocytophaga flavus]MDJ1472399.1 DUF92 domain-containing protein [Xanthocytophaga flavus]
MQLSTQIQYILVLLILLTGITLSIKAQKLTTPAAITGGLLGFLVFLGAGFPGLIMMASFFVMGTLATSWRSAYKASMGLAEENKGRRKASQVIANAGVGGILGLLNWLFPYQSELFQLMLAASFASASSDTLSSELGNVYGKRFYNVISFKPDNRGLDGVVSLEGTLLGMLGSCIIAGIYGLGFGWTWNLVWIVIAGTVGNLSDSVLGATMERKQYLSNDAVNFLNTLIGASTAMLIYSIVSQ